MELKSLLLCQVECPMLVMIFKLRLATRCVIFIMSTDDVAWDWINKKLYWTDLGTRNIQVYDPATGFRKTLLYTGSSNNPSGLVLDPNNG